MWLSITMIFTPLSAFVQSGLNLPRMTKVALGEEICALYCPRHSFLIYNLKLFNLHNWDFSLGVTISHGYLSTQCAGNASFHIST